ncbi:MAG: tRNA (guanosine(37)-N1)-methyltransferase TrmD [Dehalococcoidia bacterium]
MRITILTLFPRMFDGPLGESILRRAVEKGALQADVRDIRDYARGRHRVVDDSSYGGGPGMLMKPEPLFRAVEDVRRQSGPGGPWVVLMSPQGRTFTQRVAAELADRPHLVLICGHYEGVDERFRAHGVDEEVSIGDYVLTGGEPAALVIMDAVTRLLPGVLGDPSSPETDSFAGGLLEYPQYTRPAQFRRWKVPPVLLSGDHQAIARWRRQQAILRTLDRRPELLDLAGLSSQEVADALSSAQDDAVP